MGARASQHSVRRRCLSCRRRAQSAHHFALDAIAGHSWHHHARAVASRLVRADVGSGRPARTGMPRAPLAGAGPRSPARHHVRRKSREPRGALGRDADAHVCVAALARCGQGSIETDEGPLNPSAQSTSSCHDVRGPSFTRLSDSTRSFRKGRRRPRRRGTRSSTSACLSWCVGAVAALQLTVRARHSPPRPPLQACDALTSATAHKRPLVSPAELEQHFPSLLPIDPLHDDIQVRLQRCLDDHLTPDGRLSHTGIIECTHIVNAWLVQTERLFAQAAARASSSSAPGHEEEAPDAGADPVPGAHAAMLGGPPMSLIDDIRNVWLLLDQIHEGASTCGVARPDGSSLIPLAFELAGMRRMQELLVHLGYTPAGCARDRCADQHLRFITRLDLDLLVRRILSHSRAGSNVPADEQASRASTRRTASSLCMRS